MPAPSKSSRPHTNSAAGRVAAELFALRADKQALQRENRALKDENAQMKRMLSAGWMKPAPRRIAP